ncbi:MAG: GtrA family protein [Polyangiaceae bacterium]
MPRAAVETQLAVHVKAIGMRLLRSAGAGAVSTAVDLTAITLLVEVAKWTPRAANIPALILGGITMFIGQKYFAFRARGDVKKEIVLFVLVQAGALFLNGFLFDLGVRVSPLAARYYLILRMAVGNVVWLGYSFPLWHLVFKPRVDKPQPLPPSSPSAPT